MFIAASGKNPDGAPAVSIVTDFYEEDWCSCKAGYMLSSIHNVDCFRSRHLRNMTALAFCRPGA